MPRPKGWTPHLERGVLCALLLGDLHVPPDDLLPSLFTPPRDRLVASLRHYHGEFGSWPSLALLDEIFEDSESTAVQTFPRSDIGWVTARHQTELRRRALKSLAYDIEEWADGDPSEWGKIPTKLQRALLTAESRPEPFSWAEGIRGRHVQENGELGLLTVPTGLSGLDVPLRGGLRAGQLGLVLGPTKLGKSHMVTWFGIQALKTGTPVLHITLENDVGEVARRHDRCLTQMDDFEIAADPAQFEQKFMESSVDSSLLDILWYPRLGLTTAGVHDLLKERLDRWGQPCLLVVDYGSLLRPMKGDTKERQVSDIHLQLSAICGEEQIPAWVPFQASKEAEREDGQTDKSHANWSYEAMQHGDLILALRASRDDRMSKRMGIALDGSRTSAEAFVVVRTDWARSTVTQIG